MENEGNTLHFKITVDGNGLKDIETKSQAAFSGIKKAVTELSRESVSNLQNISLEVMEAVDRFNDLAKSVGVDPKFLRQTLAYLREMRTEQERLEKAELARIERSQNAEYKRLRQQKANLEAESRAKEKQANIEFAAEQRLAQIQIQSIRQVSKLRHDAHTQFIGDINTQNKKIKE